MATRFCPGCTAKQPTPPPSKPKRMRRVIVDTSRITSELPAAYMTFPGSMYLRLSGRAASSPKVWWGAMLSLASSPYCRKRSKGACLRKLVDLIHIREIDSIRVRGAPTSHLESYYSTVIRRIRHTYRPYCLRQTVMTHAARYLRLTTCVKT